MKKLLLLILSTFIFADSNLIDGLERGSSLYKRDACNIAKEEARKNYNVQDMNVGCNCEKSDAREWMCFVRFKHIQKED